MFKKYYVVFLMLLVPIISVSIISNIFDNINNKSVVSEPVKKEIKIEKLENQIKQFKSGKTYQDKDKVIANQERIIDEQKGIIDNLNKEIKSLKDKIERLTNIIWTKLNDAYLAVAHLLGFKNVNKDNINHDLMDYKVRDINRKHEPRYNKSTKDKSDDYEL